MAASASSLISCSSLPSRNFNTLSLSKTLSLRTPPQIHKHTSRCIIATYSPVPESNHKSSVTKFLDSCFIFCTSVALSTSLFVCDVNSAAAFVTATPRKLQNDELATVRLFQDNTPSVVYITNLASR